MAVRDLRFACVVRDQESDRQFDSIECLLKDEAPAAGMSGARVSVYLADYDQSALHAAESLWVVQGNFPSPMGAGLAAFSSLESARKVAERTAGRVARFEGLSRGVANAADDPIVEVALRVEQGGAMSPSFISVEKGKQVALGVSNAKNVPVRIELPGYEDRLPAVIVRPGETWHGSFLADLPGDDFVWMVDGRPAGRLAVTGSHLIEGHR